MRRALGVGALVAVVLVLALPTASAATRGPVGWWTRSPAASAPDGGFTVGNAPDGPVSVAAIEVDLEDGVSSASLSFAQTGGAAPTAAQLVACIIASGFGAVEAGPIEEAPATTCSTTQAPVASADGTTWKVDITELVGDRAGTVGVAIVPATGASGLWDLQLDTPTLQATAAPSGSSSGGRSPSVQPFATTATTAYRAPSTGSASSFSPPSAPAVRAPATTVAPATTTTTALAGEPIDSVALSGANTASDGGPSGRPIGQAITMAVVAAVVGIIAGVGHKVATARLAP